MEIHTKSAEETQIFGKKIGTNLIQKGRGEKATILALSGELGSGKSTFVQGLGKACGIPHRVLSPTFLVVREYTLSSTIFSHLYHIDLYKMEENADWANLGFDEIFTNPAHLVVIEWAERMKDLLPDKRIDISFRVMSGVKRQIVVQTG